MNKESGRGQIGTIIMVLILAGLIFALYKFMPIKIRADKLADFCDDFSRTGAFHMPESDAVREVVKKGRDLGLPIEESNVKVSRLGSTCNISVKLVIPIDFVVWTWQYKYEFDRSGEQY